jgi:hypothetical protein
MALVRIAFTSRGQGPLDPSDLHLREPFRKLCAGRRRVEQALTPVAFAELLLDQPRFDQRLQDAGEALFRDLQRLEEIDHALSWHPVHEVEHAMMRAAEAEIGEHGIGLGREISIGEEQEFDAPERVRAEINVASQNCVSHVD